MQTIYGSAEYHRCFPYLLHLTKLQNPRNPLQEIKPKDHTAGAMSYGGEIKQILSEDPTATNYRDGGNNHAN